MACSLRFITPFVICEFTRPRIPQNTKLKFSKSCRIFKTIQCESSATIVRRDAHYGPPIWKNDFVQSLTNKYSDEGYKRRANELKEEVRLVIQKERNTLSRLELVNAMQRLGVSYHFEDEIKAILDSSFVLTSNDFDRQTTKDLYATALQFRLFRQHGYAIPQEVFNIFKDEKGNFKMCLCEDIKGMLNLYEASYYSIEGESIMDEARDFTISHLKDYLINNDNTNNTSIYQLVSHALELPLHWRMPRLEARWFIDVYPKTNTMNHLLLQLAKYDYNLVQESHQDELKHLSQWWESTCWGEKLSFGRDNLMESYIWSLGINYKPQFAYLRKVVTKAIAILTIVDDFYDVYGTVDELELFTKVIESWDVKAMEQHPEYMQILFLQLFNSVNEMAYDILKQEGFNILPYLIKAWGDLCKAYLLEAKWYHSGYMPTMEEYMSRSWISMGVPLTLTHSFFSCTNDKTKEALQSLENYANLIQRSGMILRFGDDLGTSSAELKRGDNPKSIQCYMHETGATEEEAREHISWLISQTWKKMNADRVAKDSPFSQTFIEIAVNVARMAHCMYDFDINGHATQDSKTRHHALSLVIDPVQLEEIMIDL